MMAKQSDVVLVTGSSGLIGAAAIRVLAQKYQMVGFDRDNPPHPPTEAECVCMDLTSIEDFDAAFDRVRFAYGNRIAAVIHLAAYYDFSGESSPKYDQVTVQGTQRLLHTFARLRGGAIYLLQHDARSRAGGTRQSRHGRLSHRGHLGLSSVEG